MKKLLLILSLMVTISIYAIKPYDIKTENISLQPIHGTQIASSLTATISNKTLFISSQDAEQKRIIIFNNTGMIVNDQIITNNKPKHNIDLTYYANGTYSLHIKTETNTYIGIFTII